MKPPRPETASPASHSRFFIATTLAGLLIRVGAMLLAPRYGYLFDHDDMVRWGVQASRGGLASVYDQPPPRMRLQTWADGHWAIGERQQDRICNYPPLCVYPLAISAHGLAAVDGAPLINTWTTRLLFGGWSLIADILLAAGCAAIVARYRPGRPARIAYLLVLLAPPVWLVSCFWGQLDTWMLAPAVWMVYFMLAERWLVAGALFGLVAAIKPQAVAFLPVWALAAMRCRPAWRPSTGVLPAVGVLLLASLPFALHSGLRWWTCSYSDNLLSHSRGYTTLMAFNPWYLDCLLTGSIDENATWLGISKAAWGMAATGLALAGGVWFFARRPRIDSAALLAGTVCFLLILVMLPTRVHERFLLLVVPFLIVLAVIHPRLRLGASIVVLACTLQVTWPQWLQLGPPDWDEFVQSARVEYQQQLEAAPPAERAGLPGFDEYIRPNREEYLAGRRLPVEWLTTLLSVVGSATVLMALLRDRALIRPADQR